MYRLSLIISEIYNKYLPLAEKGSVALNLDFSDTTKTVDDPEAIKADLEKHLSSALSRSDRGEINITVGENAIVITDSGTILSKPICALLSKGRVSITSRVGFGTTVRISLLPPPPEEPAPTPTLAAKSTPAKSTSKPIQTAKQPKLTGSSQPTKKSTRPTREQRKLVAAAKKADRKIQKLRKSQQKQTAKQKKAIKLKQTTKPAQPTKQKPVAKHTAKKQSTAKPDPAKKLKKTRKKVLELS